MSDYAIDFWGILGAVFGALMLESLLYGVHLVLFCICFYILFTRRNPAHRIILLAMTTMFILATADIALTYGFVLRSVIANLRQEIDISDLVGHLLPKYLFFVTNNLIADGLLLYRCFKIWDGQKYYIISVPALLLVADSVWGYIGSSTSVISLATTFTPLFFWSVFGFNIVMTMVIAGRIWWAARAILPILGKRHARRYHTAIIILVQSGAIYSLSVLAYVIAHQNNNNYYLIFYSMTIRIVGIAPTLMIVQVELGRNSKQTGINSMGMSDNVPLVPSTVESYV